MTPTESVALARYITAHFPQQPTDEYTADALAEELAAYPFADCRAAVLTIARRGERWCAPTDVWSEVKRIRAKRLDQHPPLIPPAHLADDPVAQIEWTRDKQRRIRDGEVFDPDALYGGELKPRDLSELRALPAPEEAS